MVKHSVSPTILMTPEKSFGILSYYFWVLTVISSIVILINLLSAELISDSDCRRGIDASFSLYGAADLNSIFSTIGGALAGLCRYPVCRGFSSLPL